MSHPVGHKQGNDMAGEPPCLTSAIPDSASWPRVAAWKVTAVVVAVVIVAAGIAAYLKRDMIAQLFSQVGGGPPQVAMREVYQDKPDGPTFDHSVLDELVERHVQEGGWIDYETLREDVELLDTYISSLSQSPFDDMGRDEKLALLINAYNAFTLRLILEYYPLDSIKDIPEDKRWEDERWQVGSYTWSLNQIEHEQIRPKFKDARVHFALVCAAVGCPPLRKEAYTGNQIDKQLEEQAEYVHSQPRWFRFSKGENRVGLSELYDWYSGDFEQLAGSNLKYAAQYAPELRQALEEGKTPTVEWIRYDWSLNSVQNKPSEG